MYLLKASEVSTRVGVAGTAGTFMHEIFSIHLLLESEYVGLLAIEVANYGLDQISLVFHLISAGVDRCLRWSDCHEVGITAICA